MQKITLRHSRNLKKRECTIFVGNQTLEKIASLINLNKYSQIFIITDQNVKSALLKRVLLNLPANTASIILPAGEKEKNIENIQKIWKAMLNARCDRKSLVINLGGGMITDLGGFAASTYMRGIDFLNIPTTLLAQVDASVGGKVGFDFANVKNLIGTFDQPVAVIIDISTLVSLPKREFISGFAEIIKHGLVTDKKYFDLTTSKQPLEFTQNEIAEIIFKSIQIKAKIVQNDETEKGIRKSLNFGHTVGHAVESLSLESSTPLLHGEAISIGMIAETIIAHLLKMISVSDLQLIRQSLINAGLPVSFTYLKIDKIIQKMQSDKKNEKGEINFTLLCGIGKTAINQNVPDALVIQALKQITKP